LAFELLTPAILMGDLTRRADIFAVR